jgi:hypothetical protein
MIRVSDTYREAVANSRTVETVVDFYRDGVLIPGLTGAPVVGGRYTADRGQQVRLNCDLSLAVPEWLEIDLDVQTCRFKVRRGVSSLGFTETVQLGEFRVDAYTRPALGTISVSGSGLEAYLLDARFISPRTPPYGQSTVGTIAGLITEALPDAAIVIRCTKDRPVLATAVWERDRMDTIDDLANSIVAEVYADSTGRFVIADQPNPTTGVPVYVVDEGPGGVLVTRSEESTRDRQYNAASVAGQSTDPDVPPVWAWSADLNPASPTYYYGPFGQKPIFYTSQFFTSTFQCQDYANQLLIEALAENKTLTFTQLMADFIEVSDIVAIRTRQAVLEQHLLQSFSFQLGTSGSLVAKTLSSKIIVADGV